MEPMAPLEPVGPLKLAGTALYILAWAGSVLLVGGDARWIEGWIFFGWFAVMSMSCTAWVYLHDPALLAERYRMPGSGGQKGWDRFAVVGIVLVFLAWMALMPLDARRFGWSPHFPIAVKAAGAALLLPAWLLFFRTFKDNSFASGLVRIQSERKHRVATTGAYAVVRHPMYLGALLMFVGAPMLLGSAFGLALAALMALVLGVRIVGEEKMLVNELEGYAEYREKVRYRLVPLVW